MVERAVARTADNQRMTLVIALNYGSRNEIVHAARKLAARAVAGELAPGSIDEAAVDGALDTSDLPPPDLVVRTSGERRPSNFLLWQAAYVAPLFVDMLSPDFARAALPPHLPPLAG